MPTQYVRVLFPEMRAVLVDDAESGQTNQVLMIEEGTHRFSLDGEPDYAPSFFEQLIAGTTPAGPLELQFNPAAARAAAGVASVAAGVAAVAAGVAVVAAGVATVAANAASNAADAEHEAADAAFDAANAGADAANAPTADELRTDSDAGKPTGKE